MEGRGKGRKMERKIKKECIKDEKRKEK